MGTDPNMNFVFYSHYTDPQPSSLLQSSQFTNMNGIGTNRFDQGLANLISLSGNGNGNADVASSISFVMPPDNSPSDMVLSPARRLVHGPAWTIEWSTDEQAILKLSLEEFANDPVISKYAKIAARLRGKTVRDVAMRCQWMKKKEQDRRHKNDGLHRRKHMKDRKMNLSLERSISSSLANQNLQFIQNASYSNQNLMHNSNPVAQIPSEVWRLIEENNIVLNQIANNLDKGQMQNGALFSHVGNNIGAVLLGTNGTNGSLRKMPSLPVPINGDLFRNIWPNSSSVL